MKKEKLRYLLKRMLFGIRDKTYIKLYYRKNVGRKLNVENPTTFNEKLQWLKFNYRHPLLAVVSDKFLVREYVKEKIGEQYLIPFYGSWNSFDEICFDKLPNKFVLKCNHDSGGIYICKDKDEFNYKIAKRIIAHSLKRNFYCIGREFQYKIIEPKIICEKYLDENGKVPADYKIYCFNGEPNCILLCKDRFSDGCHRAKYYFYDLEWNFLRYNKGDEIIEPPVIEKPKNLEEMITIAKSLSKDFIFARIDLYNCNGKVYFGEITLSPNAGFDPDITYETDKLFGELLKIPYWNYIKHNI